jgi:lipid-binding SYLF domain-containing protein
MMNLRNHMTGAVVLAMMIGCATAPKTAGERANLEAEADATLGSMRQRDPGLDGMLRSSAAYVVFPSIGKGGLVAGAAYGRGILYERGRHAGYVELNQASIGAQVGAQSFAELVIFADPVDVAKLKQGAYSMAANASAIALTEGAAMSHDFEDGVAVFVVPKGGVMAELSVSGQKLNYTSGGAPVQQTVRR